VADEGAAAVPVADEEGAGALWREVDNEDAAGPEADEEDASAAWPAAVVRNDDALFKLLELKWLRTKGYVQLHPAPYVQRIQTRRLSSRHPEW
jgi:hypothetical protein